MKLSFSIVLFILCFHEISYGQVKDQDKLTTLQAAQLQPYGRFVLNKRQELELISSAVHFGFSFEGNSCTVYASIPDKTNHNYLQYELDGVYQKRIRIEGNSSDPIILKVPAPGKHKIWIYKATEAHTGPVLISRVTANNLKPLAVARAPLIEFIGNSITCGAAADTSEVPCGTGVYQDQHNAYMAYGPRVARALKVNFIVSSVSGIGVYRNWNSDGPAMPQVYEKVDFQDQNPKKWDFNNYTPNIVSIALGTNDLSNGDGKTPRKPFSADDYISSYVKFIQLVKSKYPAARIALLSSPMVSSSSRVVLEHCLTAVKDKIDAIYPKDKSVATFFFEPMVAHGCSGHPSVEDHLILAEQLKPFFKELL